MKSLLVTTYIFLALPLVALAQGVPVIDVSSMANNLKIFLHLEKDEDSQVVKAQKRHDMQDFRDQQLEAIDAVLASYGTTSSFGAKTLTGFDDIPSVDEVYGPQVNPAGKYVFGDARENIEAVIIRGAAETFSHAGVSAAGLSAVQWRCLVQALVKQESRFQIGARSPVGAFGLTQIMPETAKDLGIYPEYYENPALQVSAGARYLAQQLNSFDGNIVFGLAAYNAGPGNVRKYSGVPPFAETQHYVQVIPKYYNAYLTRIGGPEALGTIDPILLAASESSFLSNGALYFADYTQAQAYQALTRVRALVAQIEGSPSLKESIDLNSAMRAELVLLSSLRLKQRAARAKALAAQYQAVLAMQRAAEAYLRF